MTTKEALRQIGCDDFNALYNLVKFYKDRHQPAYPVDIVKVVIWLDSIGFKIEKK